MKKPTNDFSKVSRAMKVVLTELNDHRHTIEQERDLALLKHDQRWDSERRKLGISRQKDMPFDYGYTRSRSVLHEYREKRQEFAERRNLIEQKYDEQLEDVWQVKDRVLGRYHEREETRENAAPSVVKAFSRSIARRGNDRGR